MTSATFGDTFRGSGALNGTAGQVGTLAASTWTAHFGYSRSSSGGTLTFLSGTVPAQATLIKPTGVVLGSGTTVLEVAGWGCPNVIVSFPSGYFVNADFYTSTTFDWNTSTSGGSFSGSAAVSARSAATPVVVRIEIEAAAVRFYVNGALAATSAHGIAATETFGTTGSVSVGFYNDGPGQTPGATVLLLDYINFITASVSGALGAPAADTTAPTFTGGVTFSSIGYTGYTATWPAATDAGGVAGYEYGFGAAPSAWISIGTALSVSLGGRGSETFSVRAFDGAGNRSSALSAAVSVLPDLTPPVLPPGSSISVGNITTTSYTLAWPAAFDLAGVMGYRYSLGGATFDVGSTPAVSITGRTPGATDHVLVWAYDVGGNSSTSLSVDVVLLGTGSSTHITQYLSQYVSSPRITAAPGDLLGKASGSNFGVLAPGGTLLFTPGVLAGGQHHAGGQHYAGWAGSGSALAGVRLVTIWVYESGASSGRESMFFQKLVLDSSTEPIPFTLPKSAARSSLIAYGDSGVNTDFLGFTADGWAASHYSFEVGAPIWPSDSFVGAFITCQEGGYFADDGPWVEPEAYPGPPRALWVSRDPWALPDADAFYVGSSPSGTTPTPSLVAAGDTFSTAVAEAAKDAASAARAYTGDDPLIRKQLAARALLSALIVLVAARDYTDALGAAPAPYVLNAALAAVRAWMRRPESAALQEAAFAALKTLVDLLSGRSGWAVSPTRWDEIISAFTATVTAANEFATTTADGEEIWSLVVKSWRTVEGTARAASPDPYNEPLRSSPAVSAFWVGFINTYEVP